MVQWSTFRSKYIKFSGEPKALIIILWESFITKQHFIFAPFFVLSKETSLSFSYFQNDFHTKLSNGADFHGPVSTIQGDFKGLRDVEMGGLVEGIGMFFPPISLIHMLKETVHIQ